MRALGRSLLVAVMGLSAQIAIAGDCCSKCGCQAQLQKVCRAVCEMKKVKKTVWGCECKEVCIPGRTQTKDCQPRCGQVRTIRTLKKKEIECEEPSWKWVVEYVCTGCACQALAGEALSSGPVDPPKDLKPVPKPKVKPAGKSKVKPAGKSKAKPATATKK